MLRCSGVRRSSARSQSSARAATRASAAARDVPGRRAPADAHGCLRDAALGRARARARARRARRASTTRSRCFAQRPASLAADESATATQRRNASEALRVATDRLAARACRRPLGASVPRRAGGVVRAGAQGRRARGARGARRRTTVIFSRSCSSASRPSTRLRSDASPPSTSRISSSPRATSCATTTTSATTTRLRFRMVMVDEFQDTNRLQCELIDLVAHPELTEVFTVGDEFQSIYGFRHADVEVFRERRAQASNLLALTQQLPLASAGARGGEPPVRRRVRRRVPAARGLGGVPRSGVRTPRRAPGHGQVELRATPGSTGARARHGGSRARPRARRLRGGRSGRDRRAVRRRNGRRALRGGAHGARVFRPTARQGAGTSDSSRSSISSHTCGSCTTATTTLR